MWWSRNKRKLNSKTKKKNAVGEHMQPNKKSKLSIGLY